MVSEFEQIARIRKKLGAPKSDVIVGIGDDAAVVRVGKQPLVATVDALVESVHFDLAYVLPEEVGHRALAVNLSDLAAMGARAKYALVSLSLPPEKSERFVSGFYQGLAALAKKQGVQVIGGNLARSPGPIFVDVTALGEADTPVLRSGAQAGDAIAVVGRLGEAAAGLRLLRSMGRDNALSKWERLCRAQLLPQPLLEEGRFLGKGVATSLIDVSDGLASELGHIATASKVRMQIETERLPLSPVLAEAAARLSLRPLDLVLYGGEDYALLFTFRPRDWKKVHARFGDQVTVIGQVRRGPARLSIIKAGKSYRLAAAGFDHFRSP